METEALFLKWIWPDFNTSLHVTAQKCCSQTEKSKLNFQYSAHHLALHVFAWSSVPEEIKKLATLKYAPNQKQIQVVKHDTLSTVQRHAHDSSSLEAKSNSLHMGGLYFYC